MARYIICNLSKHWCSDGFSHEDRDKAYKMAEKEARFLADKEPGRYLICEVEGTINKFPFPVPQATK